MRKLIAILTITITFVFTSCARGSNDDNSAREQTNPTDFAKGADVGWLSQMEAEGKKFYAADGKETDCLELLKSYNINSIRLRVWVNPTGGWCNKADVVAQAKRAAVLGMRIMIDFHYSDSWADPQKQTKPAAWSNYSVQELTNAVAEHTKDVLQALKNARITPEWVQVGNETRNGMLWDEGAVWVWDANPANKPDNMSNYVAFSNAGYDAVKSVFPSAKVITHLDNGYDNDLFTRFFNDFKAKGGKWDVFGMSLYPSYYDANYAADKVGTCNIVLAKCIANINALIATYGKPVMICETGMPWDDAPTAKSFISKLLKGCGAINEGQCLGVFYWEPEGFFDWSRYSLSAFDNSGKPTAALEAFRLPLHRDI
jgi:arabinogalactan endo-1,4-beta-galactosidase